MPLLRPLANNFEGRSPDKGIAPLPIDHLPVGRSHHRTSGGNAEPERPNNFEQSDLGFLD
jgi:hypothetical protein